MTREEAVSVLEQELEHVQKDLKAGAIPINPVQIGDYIDATKIALTALKDRININTLLLSEELPEPKGAFRANKMVVIKLDAMCDTDSVCNDKTIAYGDWCPYKSDDPHGLSDALLNISISFILVILQRGIPASLEWIHDSICNDIRGPLPPEWVKNGEDYTIAWKARYPEEELK